MTISVKVAKVPGRIVEVALAAGSTVGQALEAAGVDASGFNIQVSGAAATVDTALSNASTVLLTQRIKGNNNLVKVAKVPGRIVEVAVDDDATVADALEAAGVDATGFTIQVNGSAATEETSVSGGATVLLTQRIKGNNNLVKVAKVPGRIVEVAVSDDATVADALEAAGVDATGFTIQVNGSAATEETSVSGGATVLLTQRIKGNR